MNFIIQELLSDVTDSRLFERSICREAECLKIY
jgi:hypothetical protein